MSFNKLKLIDPILKAIEERGYKDATFIQKKAIPQILGRKNLQVVAKTGSGKTASYAIPIVQLIHRIDKNSTDKPIIRALVVTSTDALGVQAGKTFNDYSKHTIVKHAVITKPEDKDQLALLTGGVNVLIGTAKTISKLQKEHPETISQVKMLVLDEFDATMKAESKESISGLLNGIPNKIQTICYTGEASEELDKVLQGRMENAEKFEVRPKPKRGDKKKNNSGPSKDKSKGQNKGKDGNKDAKKSKKKKKGGGRRSTEMSDKLKAKFLWPLEK